MFQNLQDATLLPGMIPHSHWGTPGPLAFISLKQLRGEPSTLLACCISVSEVHKVLYQFFWINCCLHVLELKSRAWSQVGSSVLDAIKMLAARQRVEGRKERWREGRGEGETALRASESCDLHGKGSWEFCTWLQSCQVAVGTGLRPLSHPSFSHGRV